MTRPVLVLVGPPGSGKSTVGSRIAELLGVGFRDTDRDIEADRGTTIAEIFIDQGEDAFRGYERNAVRRALAEHDGVLALGGGAVMDADTRILLGEHRVVFLDVGLTAAAKRVGFARDRPVLAASPRSILARLLDERRPLYEEVASVTVATDDATPIDVAREVCAALQLETPAR
ncbi:MAG: shikimate kinase [Mycobacteriales bacterium]